MPSPSRFGQFGCLGFYGGFTRYIPLFYWVWRLGIYADFVWILGLGIYDGDFFGVKGVGYIRCGGVWCIAGYILWV